MPCLGDWHHMQHVVCFWHHVLLQSVWPNVRWSQLAVQSLHVRARELVITAAAVTTSPRSAMLQQSCAPPPPPSSCHCRAYCITSERPSCSNKGAKAPEGASPCNMHYDGGAVQACLPAVVCARAAAGPHLLSAARLLPPASRFWHC